MGTDDAMIGACNGADPTLWTDADTGTRKGNTTAVRTCAACPVREKCAETAETLRTEIHRSGPGKMAAEWRPHGIWAGMLYDGTTRAPVRPPQTAAVVLGGEDRPTAVARR